MLYSCTHMTTVGVKGLTSLSSDYWSPRLLADDSRLEPDVKATQLLCHGHIHLCTPGHQIVSFMVTAVQLSTKLLCLSGRTYLCLYVDCRLWTARRHRCHCCSMSAAQTASSWVSYGDWLLAGWLWSAGESN